MSASPPKPNGASDTKTVEMDNKLKFIMTMYEDDNPGFAIQGWNRKAGKLGLSVATAKQRFGQYKKDFYAATEGRTPADPVIKARKKRARASDPAPPAAKKQRVERGNRGAKIGQEAVDKIPVGPAIQAAQRTQTAPATRSAPKKLPVVQAGGPRPEFRKMDWHARAEARKDRMRQAVEAAQLEQEDDDEITS